MAYGPIRHRLLTAVENGGAFSLSSSNSSSYDPSCGPHHRFSSRKSGCRPRTLHLRHGPRRSGLRRLLDVPSSQAGLIRTSRRDFNARAAGRHHGPAPPLWLYGQPQSALTTLRTRPPPPLPSDREYTPARSADKHRPEAHWRKRSILSPAVTATGTTFWAA